LPSIVLSPLGPKTCGLGPKIGWPLNQKSAPAASLKPDASGPGTTNGGAPSPFGTDRTLWKPRTSNFTEPPALIVVRRG
jgi:hypothetical protein